MGVLRDLHVLKIQETLTTCTHHLYHTFSKVIWWETRKSWIPSKRFLFPQYLLSGTSSLDSLFSLSRGSCLTCVTMAKAALSWLSARLMTLVMEGSMAPWQLVPIVVFLSHTANSSCHRKKQQEFLNIRVTAILQRKYHYGLIFKYKIKIAIVGLRPIYHLY